MIHQITKHQINKFRFTILFCSIALALTYSPFMHTDAQRDEATVAANWTFVMMKLQMTFQETV